ncbi:MAG: hypothetical protein ACTHWM_04115 [Yaniella sp.]|uniref:hypothetical protein n=1 Tax=Yaniella sp. TaxID=2773929 RepID=UPI003F9CA856
MSHILPEWANQRLRSLEIDPVDIDIVTLQEIAQNLNDDPQRDRILVGFIAGYAAGLAEGGGMATFDKAHAASVQFMYKRTSRE